MTNLRKRSRTSSEPPIHSSHPSHPCRHHCHKCQQCHLCRKCTRHHNVSHFSYTFPYLILFVSSLIWNCCNGEIVMTISHMPERVDERLSWQLASTTSTASPTSLKSSSHSTFHHVHLELRGGQEDPFHQSDQLHPSEQVDQARKSDHDDSGNEPEKQFPQTLWRSSRLLFSRAMILRGGVEDMKGTNDDGDGVGDGSGNAANRGAQDGNNKHNANDKDGEEEDNKSNAESKDAKHFNETIDALNGTIGETQVGATLDEASLPDQEAINSNSTKQWNKERLDPKCDSATNAASDNDWNSETSGENIGNWRLFSLFSSIRNPNSSATPTVATVNAVSHRWEGGLLPHRGGNGVAVEPMPTVPNEKDEKIESFTVDSSSLTDLSATSATHRDSNTDRKERSTTTSTSPTTSSNTNFNSTSKQTLTAATPSKLEKPTVSSTSKSDSSAFVVAPGTLSPRTDSKVKGKEMETPAVEYIIGKNRTLHERRKSSKSKTEEMEFSNSSNGSNITDMGAGRNDTVVEAIGNETQNGTDADVSSPANASLWEEFVGVMKYADGDSDYSSSGYWVGIDFIASFGLSTFTDTLKISKVLRPVRKAAAKATGLHGFLSGKVAGTTSAHTTHTAHMLLGEEETLRKRASTVISIDEELGIHSPVASEAERIASRYARPVARPRRWRGRRDGRSGQNGFDGRDETLQLAPNGQFPQRGPRPGRRWGFRRRGRAAAAASSAGYLVVPAKNLDLSPDAMELRRRKRVEEIDRLIQRGSARLLELQCEKDDLQKRPNPLFNYTKKSDPLFTNETFGDIRTSREFNFPPSDLVNEYIDELVSHGRLVRLNHTELWQSRSDNGRDDDDEIIGEDLLTPSADARRLYENLDDLDPGMDSSRKKNKNNGLPYPQNSGGGSWLLRRGLGRNGGSLGEKLGETIETAAYKAVASAVMSVLARILSALHGTNVMAHSDIRLYIEQDPDLPPVDKKFGPPGENYAQEAIKTAIRRGTKKKRKGHRPSHHKPSQYGDDTFLQRDAVVETLISHCQISAPLLKLFPLDWQRAMVGNIITLATSIISDFADGIQIQILGHALSFSFKAITEADMIQHIGVGGFRQNHRRAKPDEFEAAVWATAQDISESLSFLDGWLEWLERKLGGGILRSQIGNLISRVVLTLIDEVLSGARLDLWSSQANGPRLYAALEYRTTDSNSETVDSFQ